MAYTIRITRATPIAMAEWKAVVSSRDDVRLQERPTTIRNPQTGEGIKLGRAEGDVEVRVGDGWQACFLWRDRGEVTFAAPPDFDDVDSAVRMTARELARALAAHLVGEEGEEYD
jgi:hypothetical protein